MLVKAPSLKPAMSASLLAGILESAMDAIITVNAQQNVVMFNRAAETMFGFPAESVLQQPLEWLIPNRFRSAHTQQLNQFGITGATSRRMGRVSALHGLRANGQEFPIDVSISCIDTPAGKLFTAIVRDISEAERHKRVELESYASLALTASENARLLQEVSQLNAGLEQRVAERTASLARQEALFHALAEQAPQVVWTANPNGAVTYANRAWFELMGGTLADWTGTYRWFAAMHPEDVADVRANWQAANASQSQFSGIRRLLAKDGSCHTMAYRASPVLDEHGAVAFWVGIDADISEVKAIEAALRLSNEELEAFSYSVSHDLRAPLNTIDGFSHLLSKQLTGQADAKVPYYLARIQTGVAQMGQLIEDLLSLAQVARAQLRSEPVDLSLMARSVLDEWQARQPVRQVKVQIQSGLHSHGDGRLLRVVLENLLGNAWKFSAQQSQAEISMGQQADAAGGPVFFVRDNGAGFDMAYADKLFTPFQRLHAVSEFAGTGIGLATVSRVISRHGGRLWAEAAPGRGATFFFTLPRQAITV